MDTPPRPALRPSRLVFLAVVLAAYYFLGLRQLTRQTAALDQPLTNAWDRLVATNRLSTLANGTGPVALSNRIDRLEAALATLETTRHTLELGLALPADLRAKMAERFQLIDFQNERQQRSDAVVRAAREQGVALDPAVLGGGLPEYATDREYPSLLWAELALANQVLLTAIQAKVGAIRALGILPAQTHLTDRLGQPALTELSLRLEVSGPTLALLGFLEVLPLTTTEIAATGRPAVLTNKPAFFLNRFILRKHLPERPSDALLDLTVSEFVQLDRPLPPPEATRRP